MAALNSIWSSFEFASQRAKKSEFAYSGFILMYELLTGELVLNFKTTGILLPFDDENAANFWTPLAEKPESAVLSTGPTDVAVSSGVATMAPADCMMAAEALFAMDLIPDVTTEQLSMLLSIYGGSQENLIEDYFSDPDKVMAKLTLPYVDAGSSDASLHAEAEILFNNEIFGGLEVQEIEHLLKMHSGDSATAVSAYFDSPEEVVRSIQQSIQSTLAAKIGTDTGAPSLRLTGEKENKNVPSNFPLSWQLVKLVVHALCLQFPALKTKKEVCILLALITDIERRIIDISKKGAHDCTFFPPLFPYYDNKADLKSLEGMESNAYENFLADTSAYALKVLYETQYRSDDSKKTNITQPRLKDFIGPFIGRAKPEPLQPDISNYSCYDRCVDMVALSNSEWQNRLSVADIGALLSCPLKILSCFGDITCTMRTEAVSSIPFDLSLHPTAVGNPPAVAMLSRIKSDLQQNDKATEYGLSYLNGIDEVTNCEQARALLAGVCSEKLAQMINELKVLMASDTKSVLTGIIALEGLMNGISAGMISNEWNKFQFMYTACRRRRIWFEYYVASLASTNQVSDLHALNPFLDEATINIINSRVMCVLMQFVRMRQASVCIHRASVLMKTIRDVQNLIKVDSCTAVQCVDAVHVLRHELAELVSELRKERHYIDDKNGLPCLDPRFLIFEFLTGFLLRRRQVELVNDFISAHRERRSSVHQMIMVC